MIKKLVAFSVLMLAVGFLVSAITSAGESSDPCVECHRTEIPGIVKQWEDSSHSKEGVGCYDCHEAKPGDPSGYEHNHHRITAVPSPQVPHVRRFVWTHTLLDAPAADPDI